MGQLTRLLLKVGPKALEEGCEAYAVGRRLKVAEDTIFYPHLMGVCAPSPSLYGEAPCLLVEILLDHGGPGPGEEALALPPATLAMGVPSGG